MPKDFKFDFSGYATKNGLKCSDGRTILEDAFKHQDGQRVPLVWQHFHDTPDNILGHAFLENRKDGVYCYGVFNDTPSGQNARDLVEHGDIDGLSIYANRLQERSKQVMHGDIREVSLVLSGANPGAKIDNLAFAHEDGTRTFVEDEAVITTGEALSHGDDKTPPPADDKETLEDVINTMSEKQKTAMYALIGEALKDPTVVQHAEDDPADGEETVADVFNAMSEKQKLVVYAMIAEALNDPTAAHSEDDPRANYLAHNNKEGAMIMKKNVFDRSNEPETGHVLSHDQMGEILADAKRFGSLKESFLAHAEDYGFDPIDILFPDAKLVTDTPDLIKRDDTWVGTLLAEATHTPFSRIKTIFADITGEEARAKGYVTGSLKNDEVVPLLKRVTTPTTVYQKQKLDRDDVVDITDFDVVMFMKRVMRSSLNEELARAILLGDGRNASDPDKINELNIRPIVNDNADMYIQRVEVEDSTLTDDIIDEFIRARKFYKGSGSPTLWVSTDLLTEMLLVKDGMKRRMYTNINELASVLRVSKIVEVEAMNDATRKVSDEKTNKILGVMVNMKDYTIGADRGGEVAIFDDFDIDYNQQKYLIETRVSGALTKPKSAIVVEMAPAG